MVELTVDMTYGQALLDAANDENKTELILKEGKELLNLFDKEPDFFRFVSTPVLAAAKKKEVVETVLAGQISQELLNLLFVLIDKGRTKHIKAIIKRYETLINEKQGYSVGVISSVTPLSEQQLRSFEEKTSKLLQKKIKLENKLEPAILGGVRILVEGKVIDATVRKRLNDLKESLG